MSCNFGNLHSTLMLKHKDYQGMLSMLCQSGGSAQTQSCHCTDMSLTGMTTQKGDLDKLGVDCMNTGINKGDVKTVTAV